MPGLLLHVGATAQCTHAAAASIAPGQPRVLVSGQPVATPSNLITVAGCPFQIPVGVGTKPQPCVLVKWIMVSTRVQINGQPVLLQPAPGSGAGLCQSAEQIPQGPPVVSQLQMRVTGQ
jgi:uncharacterized Zn-binding protein involved in type VI secretion